MLYRWQRRLWRLGALLILTTPPASVAQTPSSSGNGASGLFLQAVAALDEPRGLCVDIPGHRDRVRLDAALMVHSCKWSIWNLDERFATDSFKTGELRMPHYGLCVGAETELAGSSLLLGKCDGRASRHWQFTKGKLRLTVNPALCLTIGPEPSTLTPGGRRLASRHVARSLGLEACGSEAEDRQRWQLTDPGR